MKFKRTVTTAVILSTFSFAISQKGFAEISQNSAGSNSDNEVSVMRQQYWDIQDLNSSIATVHSLSSQLAALEQQSNSLNSEIKNLTASQNGKRENLEKSLNVNSQTVADFEKGLAQYPPENTLVQKLQIAQKEYNAEKAALNSTDQRIVEKQEIDQQINLIDKKQKELDSLRAKLADRQDLFSNQLDPLAYFIPVFTVIVFWITDRPDFLSAGNLTAAGVGVIGVPAADWVAHYVFLHRLKKRINEESAQLQEARDKLELLSDAYYIPN